MVRLYSEWIYVDLTKNTHISSHMCMKCSQKLIARVLFPHLLKLFYISVVVAASSTPCLEEVGQSVSPAVFCVNVLENAREHVRDVLTNKASVSFCFIFIKNQASYFIE